jgi:hypothetical protein
MSLNYSIMAQGAENFLIFQKSPLIYLRPCIQIEEFPNLLDHVSIYTGRAKGGGQVKLLYLNMVAPGIWTAMLKAGTVIGQVHRPPQSARLVLGMPFRGISWNSLRWAAQQPIVST